MKKIGIVTWYKNGNYGGTLQAYALMKTLEKQGYDVEFINYDKTGKILRFLKNIVFHLCFPKSALSRDRIWRFVKKEFRQSPKFSKMSDLISYGKRYDFVICGSDQIWSSLNGVDPVYFLQFVPEYKRIAYAPSIGVPEIKPEYIDDFINYVKTIPKLSIREKMGADYIKSVAGVEPKSVLDPTFLLEQEEWLKSASNEVVTRKHLETGKYIICYFLGDDRKYSNFVEALCLKSGLPAYYISFKKKNYNKKQIVCDPLELLGILKNSAYVITDSFHGMSLSINLGVKVGVFRRFSEDDAINQNSRIYNILEQLNCNHLLLSPEDSPDVLMQQANFSLADNLKEIKKDSLDYLLDALKGNYEDK